MKILILGQGAFGTALGATWAAADHDIRFWTRASTVDDTHANTEWADLIIAAIPAQQTRTVLTSLPPVAKPIIACAKGLESISHKFQTEIILEAQPNAQPAVLSGPGFAHDLTDGKPTAMTLAGADFTLLEALSTSVLRLYGSDDVIGVQLGGALKNVIAIACGVTIAVGLGESARAAMLTRGLAEMTRLAVACGARAETLAGLSGLGDLALTCTSEQSRNYRFGLALGGALTPPKSTTEGIYTAEAAEKLGAECGIDLPITRSVARILRHEITLQDAMTDLLSRPVKEE